MDRDYTTEVETKFNECMNAFEKLNNNIYFSTSPTLFDVPSIYTYSQTHNSILTGNSLVYSTYMTQGQDVFKKVRDFDSKEAADETVQDELEDFRIALQAVRNLMKIPPLGSTVQEINYNLGRYGRDVVLARSIFGDDLLYAQSVGELGFAKQAENSRAYYEHELSEVISVDENGNVTYDMLAIERILTRDASEIIGAEYTVIATAYLYMNEDDMETLFCNMMTLSDKVDYSWYEEKISGPAVRTINKDYYEWTIDDEKWNGFTQGLNTVSLYNLAVINEYNSDYPDVADAAADWRYNIVQREAIANAVFNVHEFRAPYGKERPYIEITKTEVADGKAEYDIGFQQHYMTVDSVGWKASESSLHKSNIHISECRPGIASQFITTDHVCLTLHEYFAPYFISGSLVNPETEYALFASPEVDYEFFAENILGFVKDCGVELAEKQIYGDIPFVGNLVSDFFGAFKEYDQAVKDAVMIEIATSTLQRENVYSFFDCDVVMVTYDTYNISGECLYADAGEHTVRQVKDYNNEFGTDISIAQIINDPISVNESIRYYIENGDNGDINNVHYGD